MRADEAGNRGLRPGCGRKAGVSAGTGDGRRLYGAGGLPPPGRGGKAQRTVLVYLREAIGFKKAGFTIDEFGENTVKLSGVPEVLIDLETKDVFIALSYEFLYFSFSISILCFETLFHLFSS